MFKKFKFLLGFLFCTFILIHSNTEAKAFKGPVKAPSNFDYISKLLEKQKQNLLTSSVKGLIAAETSATTNGVINTTSKIIKNPDADFSSTIDIQDLASTAKLYNVKNTASAFNSKFDFNDDGIIDIYDLVLQSKHLGSSINTTSLNMETYVGDTFNMPSSLEVSISDGYLTNIRSSWTSTSVNTSAAASFNINGKLTDYNKSVIGEVKVTNRAQSFNSINFGLTTIYNNKIYYSNPANNFCLSRCNIDGSYVVKICNDEAFYINVISDWIYYVNGSDNNAIYKIKIDGTGRTKVVSDNAEFMNVSDGWIYYSNGSDYYTIYKAKLDGSQRIKLNDLTSLYSYLYGNEIYFCDYSTYSDGTVYGNLCSIKKDGTGYQDIAYTKMGPNVRIGNQIYFLDESGFLLYTKLDDKSNQWSINGASNRYTSINSDGKYLYASTDKNIYKYDPIEYSFPNPQVNTGGYMINIFGENIFVCSEDEGTYMMQASLQTMSPTIFGIDSIIKKLNPSTDKVYQYDNYLYLNNFPAERLDGTIFPIGVSWDNKNVETTNLGSYALMGTIQGFGSKALLTVNVVDRGNSNQNLYNFNHFAQKGEWSYFTSPSDSKLYKVKNDGSPRIKLSDDCAFSINVIGNDIYYINRDDDYIYKIKSDGTSRTKIYPQNHYSKIITDGNKIYVQKFDGIYSIDMDGSNPKKITDAVNNSIIDGGMALVGKYIVYSDKGIYAASLDGYFNKCLLPLTDNVLLMTDGRYFFWQLWPSNVVHRFDIVTGEQKELNINSLGLGTLYNNKLYYKKEDGTYECDINGLNPKRILNTQNYIMYSTQTGLYLEDEYNTKKIYSCGYDGENLTEFGGETQ
ncbi:MAG: DUF5050 domain-containing protein [Clostridiaceae bacterium]|nr:DUF5050 domain-containing protein [Clostridiaceae bacterium]